MSDTLPLLVFISLERKSDFIREEGRPLLNGGRNQIIDFPHVENMIDTLPLLVFISFERKDDPCKTGCESRSAISRLLKNEWHFTPLSVYFIREEGRLL